MGGGCGEGPHGGVHCPQDEGQGEAIEPLGCSMRWMAGELARMVEKVSEEELDEVVEVVVEAEETE